MGIRGSAPATGSPGYSRGLCLNTFKIVILANMIAKREDIPAKGQEMEKWLGPKDVIFLQNQTAGRMGLSDFTTLKRARITINGGHYLIFFGSPRFSMVDKCPIL